MVNDKWQVMNDRGDTRSRHSHWSSGMMSRVESRRSQGRMVEWSNGAGWSCFVPIDTYRPVMTAPGAWLATAASNRSGAANDPSPNANAGYGIALMQAPAKGTPSHGKVPLRHLMALRSSLRAGFVLDLPDPVPLPFRCRSLISRSIN